MHPLKGAQQKTEPKNFTVVAENLLYFQQLQQQIFITEQQLEEYCCGLEDADVLSTIENDSDYLKWIASMNTLPRNNCKEE